MAEWIRVCATSELPQPGEVAEANLQGKAVCVANRGGRFSILDNECPHRGGPLSQGWIEGDTVLCPWHAWAFHLDTGIVEAPEQGRVKVYPARIEADDLQAYLE